MVWGNRQALVSPGGGRGWSYHPEPFILIIMAARLPLLALAPLQVWLLQLGWGLSPEAEIPLPLRMGLGSDPQPPSTWRFQSAPQHEAHTLSCPAPMSTLTATADMRPAEPLSQWDWQGAVGAGLARAGTWRSCRVQGPLLWV